jgi:HEAT repeat protein
VLGILFLGYLSLVVPGSPIHFTRLFAPEPRDNGRTVRELIRALGDPDPAIRREAALGLGRLNSAATRALPRLAETLRGDPERTVRAAAAEAIRKMHPASREVLGDLAQALRDPEPMVRMQSALALLSLKEEARPAISNLISGAEDEDNDTNLDQFSMTIRQAMLRALSLAAAGTGDAVPTLSALLGPSSPDASRAIAARGLGLAGPHAHATAPKLRRLLSDHNADVRTAAEEALALIGADRSGPIHVTEYDNLELPESERQRIWEIEHRVNVLNVHGFDLLAAALARGEAAELARFLAPDFVGSEPAAPNRVRSSGFMEVERLRLSGSSTTPLSAAEIVNRLMSHRRLFGSVPKVKLVAATLRPRDAWNSKGSWEGQAQLRMHGESTAGGPREVTALLGFELHHPTEAAFASGGWLRAIHIQQVAVAHSPYQLFAETAETRGLNVAALHDNWKVDDIVPSSGGVFATDFNRDGYLDLLVTDLKSTALYRGDESGRFTDVTKSVGLPRTGSWSTKAAWVDLDGDGWDDLILHEQVYRNEVGKQFADYTERCSPRFPGNRSSILVADYDRDGKLDLYFTRTGSPGNLSWLDGRSNDTPGNLLYRNLGNWNFEDATKKSGTRGGFRSTFSAAWLDANDDGWPDLHVPNEFGDGVLFVNNHDGTFKPRALADRSADFGTMGLAVGDLDNDGRIDVYCANMYSKAGTRVIGNMKADSYPPQVMEKLRRFVAGSQLHLNRGNGTFEQVGAQKQLASVGWAYGAALADLDGDGWLDVYATAGYISRDRTKPDG